MKLINQEGIPNITALLDSVMKSKSQDTQTEMLRFCIGDVYEMLEANRPDAYHQKLMRYYKMWVELSQKEDEKEILKYFEELGKLGIDSNEEIRYTFCKVMVQESIELSQRTADG